MGTGKFRARSAPPSSYPGIPILSCPRPGALPGAPFCPTQRRAVASHPKKVAASPPLYSRNLRRPGALQQLAEFLSSFLQKLHRKLQTPLALQRPGLRQRPPARRPQLLPRRPAFVLLPHPALQPGRNSRIPLRRWGAADVGPFSGPSRLCPRVPASEGAPGAGRSKLSTAASVALLAPAAAAPLCALGSRRGSQPPGRRGPPSFAGGIGGRASRMRRRPPHPAGRGAGNWSLSFARAGCFSCPHSTPARAESFLSPSRGLPVVAGTPGGLLDTRYAHAVSAGTAAPPARATRERRGQDAPRKFGLSGRMLPESSVSRVRCSNLPLVSSTCFFFLTSSAMRRWMSKGKIPTEAPQTRS